MCNHSFSIVCLEMAAEAYLGGTHSQTFLIYLEKNYQPTEMHHNVHITIKETNWKFVHGFIQDGCGFEIELE